MKKKPTTNTSKMPLILIAVFIIGSLGLLTFSSAASSVISGINPSNQELDKSDPEAEGGSYVEFRARVTAPPTPPITPDPTPDPTPEPTPSDVPGPTPSCSSLKVTSKGGNSFEFEAMGEIANNNFRRLGYNFYVNGSLVSEDDDRFYTYTASNEGEFTAYTRIRVRNVESRDVIESGPRCKARFEYKAGERVKSIYSIGDSITTSGNWQNKLRTSLAGIGVTDIYYEAKGSRKITDATTIVAADANRVAQYDAVYTNLGINGCCSSIASVEEKSRELIAEIRKAKPGIPIFWSEVYATTGVYFDANAIQFSVYQTNDVFKKLADEGLIYLLPWEAHVDNNPSIKSIFSSGDGIHIAPNGDGPFADFITSEIDKIIQ